MRSNINHLRKFIRIFFYLALGILIYPGFYGCSGCSKSGVSSHQSRSHERAAPEVVQNKPDPIVNIVNEPDSDVNVVKMIKQDGVYHIPVEINGVSLYFIFDTGAGLISISSKEAYDLYRQGKLTHEDVIGTANFLNANGDISNGIIINLREVKIGNKILNNVKASVSENLDAPLLVGQSALEKFGKISLDYEKSEITFE
jgi:aspartyl protease family protein